MTYEIEFTPDAQEHLSGFTKREQGILLDAIEEQLSHRPAAETRKRKRLRPNPLASWELRAGNLRAFYDVDSDMRVVMIVAIGKKRHNILYVGGKEYAL